MGSEQDYAIAERVNTVAERLGCKPAQVALAWVLGLPGVTAPIVGASKPHHLPDAVGALSIQLDAETRATGGALPAQARLGAHLKILILWRVAWMSGSSAWERWGARWRPICSPDQPSTSTWPRPSRPSAPPAPNPQENPIAHRPRPRFVLRGLSYACQRPSMETEGGTSSSSIRGGSSPAR